MNARKYMRKQGIELYGTPPKKRLITIRFSNKQDDGVIDSKESEHRIKVSKILKVLWKGIIRTINGLKIMIEGAKKASESPTGKKIQSGIENAYNNFYGEKNLSTKEKKEENDNKDFRLPINLDYKF